MSFSEVASGNIKSSVSEHIVSLTEKEEFLLQLSVVLDTKARNMLVCV